MGVTASATPKTETRLLKRIKRISAATDGVVGIAAFHQASGFTFHFNPTIQFPMASTYKVPLALLFLSKVDKGLFDLNHRITIKETNLRPGDNLIGKRYASGISLSYRDLVRVMIELSDNTATDIIFKAVGGPKAVNDFLKSSGIENINVSRTTLALIADYCGVTGLNREDCTLKHYKNRYKMVDRKKRAETLSKFYNDTRDTATPPAMIEVLKLIDKKKLKEETFNLLMDSMRLCQTGLKRICAQLPELAIAQKTGNMSCWPNDQVIANDIALITMPDGSILHLAVFIKKSTTSKASRERVIARIAKTIVNHVKHTHKTKCPLI